MSRARRFAVVSAALLLAAGVAGCQGLNVPTTSSSTAAYHPPSVSAPSGLTYRVQAGDTIYVVARRLDVPLRSLIDANGLAPPYALATGQILRVPAGGGYIVQRGDTLSGVARKTGVEFGTLARLNHLAAPYVIRVGMRLQMPSEKAPPETFVIQSPRLAAAESPAAQSHAAPPAAKPAPVAGVGVATLEAPPTRPQTETRQAASPPNPFGTATPNPATTAPTSEPQTPPPPAPASPAQTASLGSPPKPFGESAGKPESPVPPPTPAASPATHEPQPAFIWPLHGSVIANFGADTNGQHNDGLNIAVPRGTAVDAVADGEVKYAGNELRGYGNLLLIQHTGGWMSAYAHNDTLLVKRGDHVKRGQLIARSGDSGGVSPPQLHFELRHGDAGETVHAVDPMSVLPAQAAGEGASPKG